MRSTVTQDLLLAGKTVKATFFPVWEDGKAYPNLHVKTSNHVPLEVNFGIIESVGKK